MKDGSEILEIIAAAPDHIVDEGVFFDDLGIDQYGAQMRVLNGLIESEQLIYAPLLAGTSGEGAYALPDSPEIPKLRQMHAEWNAKHLDQADRWPLAKAFGAKNQEDHERERS